MEIIDAHAHIYDQLTGYGAKGEFRPLGDGWGVWATGEKEQFLPAQYGDRAFLAETLLTLMAENHVSRAVLLQAGNYGFHNDYAAEAAHKYPGRFTAVATLDPYAGRAQDILEHFIRDYHTTALKFEVSAEWGMTGYHPLLKLDGEVFRPILSRANELEMTVVYDLGFMGTPSFDPDALFRVRREYPNITFVLTHCFFPCADGQNDFRLRTISALASDRFLFDISNLPPCVAPEPFPYVSQQEFLRKMRAAVGAERMIWGTDIPGVLRRYSYRELIEYVTESGIFTGRELDQVMGGNARRVYHISRARLSEQAKP